MSSSTTTAARTIVKKDIGMDTSSIRSLKFGCAGTAEIPKQFGDFGQIYYLTFLPDGFGMEQCTSPRQNYRKIANSKI